MEFQKCFFILFCVCIFTQVIYADPPTPSDDVFIATAGQGEFRPDENYNHLNHLLAASPGGGHRCRTLIKWDIENIPEDYELESARLTLRTSQVSNVERERTLIICRLTGDWNEEEATWNNSAHLFDGEVARFSLERAGLIEVEITEIVNDWLEGNIQNHGLGIRAVDEINDPLTGFCSKEWDPVDWGPQLILEPEILPTFRFTDDIPDVRVQEDVGRHDILDLDDIIEWRGDGNIRWIIPNDPAQLNMGNEGVTNILYISPDNNYNIANGMPFTIEAESPDGRTIESNEFEITIEPTNDIPEWTNTPQDPITVNEGDQIEFNITAEDIDLEFEGDNHNLEFEDDGVIDLGAVINENGQLSWTFNWDTDDGDAGDYNLVFTITDADNASDEAPVPISVRPQDGNQPPIIIEPSRDAEIEIEGAALFNLIVEFRATDEDDDALNWQMDENGDLPQNAFRDNGDGTAVLEWTPTFDDVGNQFQIFTVDDGNEGSDNIDIQFSIGTRLRHFTDFDPTQENHSILITEFTFDEEPAPSGFEIGVFTPDGILAGAGVWIEGENLGFPAWGDDENTEVIEGFDDGQMMHFRVWDSEVDAEYNGHPEIIRGELAWDNGALTILTLESRSEIEQRIPITEGWNLISLRLIPAVEYWDEHERRGPLPQLMMEQLIWENPDDDMVHHLYLLKNGDGDFCMPDWNYWGIPFWNSHEGYWLSFRGDDPDDDDEAFELYYHGTEIPNDEEIRLIQGWNTVAYLPGHELPSDPPDYYVLSPIFNYVEIAKDGEGNFLYDNEELNIHFSNMGDWGPGNGYMIKIIGVDEIEFQYPPQQDDEMAFCEKPITSFGKSFQNSSVNMSLLVTIPNSLTIHPNGLIQAVDTFGQIVGEGFVNQQNQCGIAVWGDEETTAVREGLIDGESFTLRFWVEDQERAIDISISAILTGEGLVYKTNSFTAIEVELIGIPNNFYIDTVYPNPFNMEMIIPFGLPSTGNVVIGIYDITGRLVLKLVDGELNAGHHEVVWNAEDASTGLYIIRIESAGRKHIQKATLIR